MNSTTAHKILVVSFITLIFGLLLFQRFETTPSFKVTVLHSEPAITESSEFSRGEFVETGSDEFVLLSLGPHKIALAQNSEIEIDRVYQDEQRITLHKGRIFTHASGETPLHIETVSTENILQENSASLVRYDFLDTLHVIPLEGGTIQTKLKSSAETLLLPVPMSIHETDSQLSKLDVNLSAGDSLRFYQWVADQLQ